MSLSQNSAAENIHSCSGPPFCMGHRPCLTKIAPHGGQNQTNRQRKHKYVTGSDREKKKPRHEKYSGKTLEHEKKPRDIRYRT